MFSLCYKYELKTFILFIMFLIAWKICRTLKFSGFHSVLPKDSILLGYDTLKADSHIACCAHAVPLPCRAAKGLVCFFPIWFTHCGHVWFTLAMPCPCPALTMPFFSRPWQSSASERRPLGYLPVFDFFQLPRRVPQRLLSEAYQFFSQWFIPKTVKSGSRHTTKKTIC